MKASDYLNQWVLWGGVPARRSEVYQWAAETGARFHPGDGPAISEEDAQRLLRAMGKD